LNIQWRQSPNYNARPPSKGVELVVIHATAGTSEEGDLSWLCSPKSRVSYHYLVGRTGALYQLVQESRRAWHAGRSRWLGKDNCNDFSIGSHSPTTRMRERTRRSK
jgi:N-acetylmuramoyl-L-alanine amidase